MKMGSHPANLVFRFLLEATSLVAIGAWGWHQGHNLFGGILAVAAPLAAAGLWGTFAVPGDPTLEGGAPVVVPGILRLMLEASVFGFAVWGLVESDMVVLAWVYGLLILAHYFLSFDRIKWLMRRGAPGTHERHHPHP